jgi:predicted regulator of Ras-like GTPase activity (Roadblock/LC7/MglB family)
VTDIPAKHGTYGIQENSMTKNRAELMVERLRNMQAAAPDIEASAVVSVDGLIMASALQQGVEEDRVSAMSAAMLSLGERISTELGRKGLEQVSIKGNKGSIVLTSIGEEAVLTVMARQDAKLGMILLEMRRAAEDIFKLVG